MITLTIDDNEQFENVLGIEEIKPEELFTEINLNIPKNWQEITFEEFYQEERFPRKQRALIFITELACCVHIRQRNGEMKNIYFKMNVNEQE